MINQTLRALFLGASIVAAASSAAFAQSPAWLVQATGLVEVAGPSGPIEAKTPALLPEGTTVKTGSDGLALIMTADGSKVQVRANSSFTFTTASPTETAFSLLKGAISCWVTHLSGRRFNVHAPGSVAAVRGTVFDVATDGKTSKFDLFQGEILIADSFGGKMIQTPGQRVTVNTAHGLAGTSSLPPGVHAEAEPPAALPPAAKQTAAAPKPKTPAPALASDTDIPPPPAPAPLPPPEQEQATTVVSPSAP
jgi:ferric-dicitrate binding protein FerR (iron transport regulator)